MSVHNVNKSRASDDLALTGKGDHPTNVKTSPNDVCSICRDDIQLLDTNRRVKGLVCAHAFHEMCINQWLAIKNECPNCRVNLGATESHASPGPNLVEFTAWANDALDLLLDPSRPDSIISDEIRDRYIVYAAYTGRLTDLQFLLDMRKETISKSKIDEALSIAAGAGHFDCYRLLLQQGPSLRARQRAAEFAECIVQQRNIALPDFVRQELQLPAQPEQELPTQAMPVQVRQNKFEGMFVAFMSAVVAVNIFARVLGLF